MIVTSSGWWVLILFVPILGFFWAIIDLGILEGHPDPTVSDPIPQV